MKRAHQLEKEIFLSAIRLLTNRGLGNITITNKIYKLTISHLKSPQDIVSVREHKMVLDANDSLELSVFGIYAKFMTKLIMREIKKGDVVLDVGANIGYFTLIFAHLVGEEGRVFAFEPDPTNFTILEKNIEINGYKNVVAIQKAVSNHTGKDKLYLHDINTGMHRLSKQPLNNHHIEVNTICLDDYFTKNTKIDFIKLDVEGSEYAVVEGAHSVLQENKNIKLITEFTPTALKKYGSNATEYISLLASHGFLLRLMNEQKGILEYFQMSEIEENETHNLFCIKTEKQSYETNNR